MKQNDDKMYLEKATAAIDEAFKNLGKDKIKALVENVSAMGFTGQTLDEYAANFEDINTAYIILK